MTRSTYSGYEVHISSRSRSVPVRYEPYCSGTLKVVYTVWRVPSQRRFVVAMREGATTEDLAYVLSIRSSIAKRFRLWEENHPRAVRKLRRSDGTYCYIASSGPLCDDPCVQLELEMMIDLSTDAENRSATLR